MDRCSLLPRERGCNLPDSNPYDLVITNATLVTCQGDAPDDVGLIPGGSLSITDGVITAIGVGASGKRVIDAGGRVVMPGFVDAHTHVVWGGTRLDEYAARVSGLPLEPLREQGVPVGINGTVRETRALGVDGLVEQSLPRLREMLEYGTTTVESKSGYALSVEGELRMLQANRQLASLLPVEIISTLMGAHALPEDRSRERYITEIIEEMIPAAAEGKLATFCDVFCESGYFTVAEAEAVLEAGIAHGLVPKIHLDQYEHSGAAGIAAQLGCVSADHLNYTTEAELRTLAAAGVVAIPLPGLDLAVAHPQPVNIRGLYNAGMTVALATDICPGCWMPSMQLVIALACRLYGMSPAEAVRAATLGAATAVGRQEDLGSLEAGKQADILILDSDRYEDLAYRFGHNAVDVVIKRGQVVVERHEVA